MSDDANHFSRGFLSATISDVRELVRQRYAACVTVFDDVNVLSVERQHAISIHLDNQTEMYGAALFARTIASTQAAALLLEHGLLPQARTVLRAALETLFPLCAIELKPELTAKLLASHDADKRTVAERISRWKDPNLRAAIDADTSPEELKGYSESKAEGLNHFKIAVAADMEDWYLSVYMLLSFSAHGAVSDLTSHIVRDEQGQVVEFKNEPEIDGQQGSWTYAIEIQLKALQALSNLFKLDATPVEVLAAQFKSSPCGVEV